MLTTRLSIRFALVLAPVLAPALAIAAGDSPGKGEVMKWNVAGTQRRAIVYAPSSAVNAKTPLLFAFHGRGDTNGNFQEGVELEKAWPQAIVVYPQGLRVSRGADLTGWQNEKGDEKARDLEFVDKALASLRAKYKVDDARIYATGFSNGAVFTYLLWAERPNVFAAFAAVAARLGDSVLPTVPKPFLQVGGRKDGNIDFALQEHAMETARRVDGVSKGEPCGPTCTLYPSAKGTPVMTFIHDGGHEWPDGISHQIAKFFQDHPSGH